MSINKRTYGISILNHSGETVVAENALAWFETMSAIKSPIGTLAVKSALERHDDLDTTQLMVTPDHDSNGNGEWKHRLGDNGQFSVPLREALEANIEKSDCVASNILIDYLGGKDAINDRIEREIGSKGMKLLTDRLHSSGVDHLKEPHQVGQSTMHDLARYYYEEWANIADDTAPELAWHRSLHGRAPFAHLFGVAKEQLEAENIQWLHKTASGEDVRGDTLYSTMVDAGQLIINNQPLYVAAALTVNHAGSHMPSREEIRRIYVENNKKALQRALESTE